jgi:hypothetical protein
MVINKKFRFSVSWRTLALEFFFYVGKKKRKKRQLRPVVSIIPPTDVQFIG